MNESLIKLRRRLESLPAGEVEDSDAVMDLLRSCWECFTNSNDTNMAAEKVDRARELRWEPPKLTFIIERHGGTVLGASGAELYAWALNLETVEANCETSGHRQVHPMDKRLDVKPLASEIAELIVNHKSDRRLKWSPDGKVQVLIGEVIPETNKQTTAGRRSRFRNELEELLVDKGWETIRPNFYRPVSDSGTS